MKRLIVILFCLVLLVGCTEVYEDGHVYLAGSGVGATPGNGTIDGDGPDPFIPDISHLAAILKPGDIPLTISPDGSQLFVMQRVGPYEDSVIKGPPETRVEVFRVDLGNGRRQLVVNMLFVNLVRWNPQGNKLALCGGEEMRLYDLAQNRVLFTPWQSTSIPCIQLGWSPDGQKLYTWSPHGHGAIYYVETETLVMPYEMPEDLYYWQQYDEAAYLGSARIPGEEMDPKSGTPQIAPVLVDRAGAILRSFPAGELQDAYGKSLLLLENGGFDLTLIPDVGNLEQVRKVASGLFIYQARFLPGGKLVYTTPIDDISRNEFRLTIVGLDGKVEKSFEVSGAYFSVAPDGKTIFVAGPKNEYIFVERLQLNMILNDHQQGRIQHPPEILAAVRGATTAYYRIAFGGYTEPPVGWFINSQDLTQTAAQDLVWRFGLAATDDLGSGSVKWPVELKIRLHQLTLASDASVRLHVLARNSRGEWSSIKHAWELRQVETPGQGMRWAVVGMSTFPNSKESASVRNKVTSLLPRLKSGELLSGQLKDRDITVGQVQLLAGGDQSPAGELEAVAFARVYLRVKRPQPATNLGPWDDPEYELYWLLLDKDGGQWNLVKANKLGN